MDAARSNGSRARWSTWTDEDLSIGERGTRDALCEATEAGEGAQPIIDLLDSIMTERAARGTL